MSECVHKNPLVEIQRYAGGYEVRGHQVLPVVREATGVSGLLSKPRQVQTRRHWQPNASRYWGDRATHIICIVPKKNFEIEEGFNDKR